METDRRIDEGLELLYLLRERGGSTVRAFLRECSEAEPGDLLRQLLETGLAQRDREQLALTDRGMGRAEEVIRRHRLAEVLMRTVLQIEEKEMAEAACVFEHILSEDACDRVCAFLGHPTHCPHDLAIPPGRCCRISGPQEQRVQPLTEMEVGSLCEVVHIRPRHHTRLDRLGAYGLLPKSMIRLHQKKPSYVIQIDETDLAIDADVARDIYVRTHPTASGETS